MKVTVRAAASLPIPHRTPLVVYQVRGSNGDGINNATTVGKITTILIFTYQRPNGDYISGQSATRWYKRSVRLQLYQACVRTTDRRFGTYSSCIPGRAHSKTRGARGAAGCISGRTDANTAVTALCRKKLNTQHHRNKPKQTYLKNISVEAMKETTLPPFRLIGIGKSEHDIIPGFQVLPPVITVFMAPARSYKLLYSYHITSCDIC